jgi:hypothetical protein
MVKQGGEIQPNTFVRKEVRKAVVGAHLRVRPLVGGHLGPPLQKITVCLRRYMKPKCCEPRGETVKKGWQFLSLRWWVVHFLGFALVYTAGRLTAALMKG